MRGIKSATSKRKQVSRRAFCAGVASLPLVRVIGAAEPKPTSAPLRLRYVLASSMYGTTKLDAIAPEVAKCGAEGLDLWPRPHGDQREQAELMGRPRLEALLAKHKTRLAMTTRYDLGPFQLHDELSYVRALGGSIIVTGSSGPPDLSGAECKQAVKQFVEKMKPHVAAAEAAGVTIGIENHVRALISTPDSLRYLADLTPSRRMGIAFAPYHLPQDAKVLAKLISDLGDRLVHFYAWQHGDGAAQKLPKQREMKQMPGLGPLDFGPTLDALRRIGFQGYTQIFMHPFPRGIAIRGSTAEVTDEVNRAREYLEGKLSGKAAR